MERSIYLREIYRRLVGIYEKTMQYYKVLMGLRNRMGVHTELTEFLKGKIDMKSRFAMELGRLIDRSLRPKVTGNLIRRPVALFWVSEEELSDATCAGTAKSLILSAELRAFNEYGYLLDVPDVPAPVAELALEHRSVLRKDILKVSDKLSDIPSNIIYRKKIYMGLDEEQGSK